MAAEAHVSFVLGKLGNFLAQEAACLYGVRDQVEWVERELRRMQCFLKDADAEPSSDARVKNWVADVRDIAYDAEDVIDTILRTEQQRRSGYVGFFKRRMFINVELSARDEVSNGIEQIKNKIREISASTLTFGIKDLEEGSSSRAESLQRQRRTSPLFEETEIVGFEEDVKTLVGRLIKGTPRCCVVSVVGMGGIGKTTLAMKVYNNDAVKKHFDCFAWVSVSQECVLNDLLQSIIKCFMTLTKEELETADEVQLRQKLFDHLKERRYLVVLDNMWKVVLDNMWKTKAWDYLVDVFPNTNRGSRVLLTTRYRDVASYADARSSPHMLQLLGEEDGWKLLSKKAFLQQDIHYPQNLEKIGKEIVEKCCGLPLAIVVIGGLLSRKATDANEWEKVLRKISSQFIDEEFPITRILALSYEDLSYRLKPFFLYFGVFPEDHEIRVKKLIQLWTAEGFVELTGEEAAEVCLEELIHRSLIQVAKRSSIGGVKSCRIHDLLRELSISKAKEDNFLDVQNQHTNPLSPPKGRRFAIHQAPSKFTFLNGSNLHLRSVLWITINSGWLRKEQEKFLYRRFNLLRVLDLSYIKIPKLPNEIGTLIHLRYLGVMVDPLMTFYEFFLNVKRSTPTSLPSSMINLHNLETLYVRESSCSIYIPNFIWKMKQLRHVDVPKGLIISEGLWSKIVRHPSLELDCLANLETLKGVRAGDWIEDCLGKQTNLKRLDIREILWSGHGKGLFNSLPKLDHLQSLSLQWEDAIPVFLSFSHHLHLKKMFLRGKLKELPESYKFSPNLTKLTLEGSKLMEDPMETFEKLPNLRILRLLLDSYKGKKMVCSAQGFPQLEYLHVEKLDKLEEWRVEKGAMPRLSHLLIWECSHLKMLPEGLQCVTTLKKLEVRKMDYEFQARMWEDGGEDWYKIQHIPSIEIQ